MAATYKWTLNFEGEIPTGFSLHADGVRVGSVALSATTTSYRWVLAAGGQQAKGSMPTLGLAQAELLTVARDVMGK